MNSEKPIQNRSPTCCSELNKGRLLYLRSRTPSFHLSDPIHSLPLEITASPFKGCRERRVWLLRHNPFGPHGSLHAGSRGDRSHIAL